MAVDLATLGLRLTNAQAIGDAKTTGQALEEMGVKGETAARKIAASSNPVTQAIKAQAVTVEQARRAWAASGGDMSRFGQELQKMVGVQNQVTASLARVEPVAHAGRLSLGRLGNQFTNLIGQIAGTHPVLGNVLSVLGNFAIGSVIMTGVLGGLALLAAAYNLITSSAREAKKSADDMTRSYVEQARAVEAATVAGRENLKLIAEINLERVKGESGVGWRSVVGTLLTGKPSIDVTDAERQAKRIADAQTRVEQTTLDWTKAVETARKEAADKALAAADKLRAVRAKDATEEMQLQAQIAALRLKAILDELKVVAHVQDVRREVIQEREQMEAAFAQKRADEEARINKNLVREMQQTWSQFFSDTLTKGLSSFRDLFDGIKQLVLKLIGDMLAAGMMRRMAGIVGGMAVGGSSAAGSGGMLGGLGRQMIGQGVAGGVAGGLIGYGVGSMIGSPGMGALGGAASGAAAGFMVGGPIGAVVGGLAGLAGGLIGGAKAAREHAKALAEAQAALKLSFADLRATVAGDTLGKALAQNASELQKFLLQINAALSGTKNEVERNRQRAEATTLFGQLAEQIKAQTAQAAKYATEDLVVRNLKATGRGDEAGLLAFQQAQAREMQAAIDANKDALYLNNLATTLNNELIAYQNGLLATAMRNAPTGFYGVERYLGQYATPSGPAGYPTDGGLPPVNPAGPNTGPGGLRPPGGRAPITIILTLDGKVVAKTFVDNLDQKAASTGGAGSSRADALELM